MNGKGCRVLCPPNKTKKNRKPFCTIITQTVCVIYTFQTAFRRHRWDGGGKVGVCGVVASADRRHLYWLQFTQRCPSLVTFMPLCVFCCFNERVRFFFSFKHVPSVFITPGSIPIDPFSIYHTMTTSTPNCDPPPSRTPPTPSVCPPPGHSLYYSLSRERLQSFMAYSSCDCSSSALWDACPDPPPTLPMATNF